ncbi:MAG: DUF2508 family protein [Bacillota bacterium]|nr:DUF2508 family protein [Bacillota bacterium]
MSGPMASWLRRCRALREKNRGLDDCKILAEAHREWMAARKLFDFATEPDLVDYAIHSLKAAEKRYIYLWKKARQKV